MPEAAAAASIEQALRGATDVLAEAGCDTPRLDAELLLAEALGVPRERLVLDADRPLDPDTMVRLGRLVARRADREPIAYILGRKEFRHITLAVDRRVLIPRPETELLVEFGTALDEGARVVDVGTGSGAVALALKQERPDLEVWATELSADALELARANARALDLDVRFVEANLLAGVPGRIDAVLGNLPYVALGSVLAPEIARYEPAGALFAGPDGLEVIRRLASQLRRVPLVALEVGFDQADAVAALLREAGLWSIEVLQDLAGHDRVVVGRRV
ncbi:MAG TPA: peptide chain release factor N(5)-glutamine methyltransferase [Solirubrobacteraceae bacterium]